jgi:alpha-tubulin suppressor-like RCC1 family protein
MDGSTGTEDLALGDAPGEMGTQLPFVNLGAGRTALSAAIGSGMICAVLDNRTLKCWGHNAAGRLGLGSSAAQIGIYSTETPDQLSTVDLGTGFDVFKVSASSTHTCAISTQHDLKCWGDNDNGQLGYGNATSRGSLSTQMGNNLPLVNVGTGRKVLDVSSGSARTCALLDNGKVKCWGTGTSGRLGSGATASLGDEAGEMGDSLPFVNLGTDVRIHAIAGTSATLCTISSTQTLRCFGSNGDGQVGIGGSGNIGDAAIEMGDTMTATLLGTGLFPTFVSDTGIGLHYCAILNDSSTKCWGDGAFGKLGRGSTGDIGDQANEMGDFNSAINLGTGRTARSVHNADSHTCAVLDDSSIKCWGRGTFGTLGSGDVQHLGDSAGEMGDSLPTVDLAL